MGLFLAIILGYGFLVSIGFLVYCAIKGLGLLQPLVMMGIILICSGGLFYTFYTNLLPSDDLKKVLVWTGMPIEISTPETSTPLIVNKEKAYYEAFSSVNDLITTAENEFNELMDQLNTNRTLQSSEHWRTEFHNVIKKYNDAFLPMLQYPEKDVPEQYKEFHKVFLTYANQMIEAQNLFMDGMLYKDRDKMKQSSVLLAEAANYLLEQTKSIKEPTPVY